MKRKSGGPAGPPPFQSSAAALLHFGHHFAEALLRLEMAADVHTPADQLAARRALQLQMLTRRNDPSPQQTWGQDVAAVLASGSDEATARRLQTALKQLLRK